MLFVKADQAVAVLPVSDRGFERDFFGVRNVVGNAAAFVGGEACRQRDFAKQSGVRRAMAHLNRFFQCFDDAPAFGQAVVDRRETVEQ